MRLIFRVPSLVSRFNNKHEYQVSCQHREVHQRHDSRVVVEVQRLTVGERPRPPPEGERDRHGRSLVGGNSDGHGFRCDESGIGGTNPRIKIYYHKYQL